MFGTGEISPVELEGYIFYMAGDYDNNYLLLFFPLGFSEDGFNAPAGLMLLDIGDLP